MHKVIVVAVAFAALGLPSIALPAQQRPRRISPRTQPKPAEPAPRPAPKPVEPPPPPPGPSVWHDPGRIDQLDFTHGVGRAKKVPIPPFTFVEEDDDGSNPKVRVTDSAGRRWIVKWGSEVHSEVFASRLAWAAGYWVEPTYFVPSGRILGVGKLERSRKYVERDGSFKDARFELKEKDVDRQTGKESWRWDRNPFVGTKELNGLKIIMMLTSNWDSKDQRDVDRGSNTGIFSVPKTGELRYVITDWGGSMGKWGSYFKREKWDCKGFSDQSEKFVQSVNNGVITFGYSGQRTDDIREGIRVSDLRWLLGYLGRITDMQIRDALRASGATYQEVDCFTGSIRYRINQLRKAAGQ